MNFEGDEYSSAWAHIALCADLTWATEPPDEFIIANQRIWAQHRQITQVLQAAALDSSNTASNNKRDISEKRISSNPTYGNGTYNGRLSVKDVIPESRLAQFYGNFYYDELREQCYSTSFENLNSCYYNGNGCENSDVTECWMLPEVEYWFKKLMDESSEARGTQQRRRQYKMLTEDDFERSGPGGRGEAQLAARLSGVRSLWGARPSPSSPFPAAPGPPHSSRKIRARRRQPRRLLHSPTPKYYLQTPVPLLCDPNCKFQFDTPQPPQLSGCQRNLPALSASVQAVMRATAARCLPYRGTNISRYTPTSQRPARCADKRYSIYCPKNYTALRYSDRIITNNNAHQEECTESSRKQPPEEVIEEQSKSVEESSSEEKVQINEEESNTSEILDKIDSPKKENVVIDNQIPSTSSGASDLGMMKKRLYSTVLSTQPIHLSNVRIQQKTIIPGLLKLNPKIVLPAARVRQPNVENKFEELEKEALEQYKASDESIDTKFSELEKQAVEQYNTSNSNTSCSSGFSTEKPETPVTEDRGHSKFAENNVDSVVIYSQNFPDLNSKAQTSSMMNLKNFQIPQRGEKKEQSHRSNKQRNMKIENQRAASDTDYEAKERKARKGSMKWMLHVIPPKKRHMAIYVSDTSDEDLDEAQKSIINDGPSIKNRSGNKLKMSAHGGGDLRPVMRKST